jgi:hypothetical protein
MTSEKDLRERYSLSKKDWRLFSTNMAIRHPHVKWAGRVSLDKYTPWEVGQKEDYLISADQRICIACVAAPDTIPMEEFLNNPDASLTWRRWKGHGTEEDLQEAFLDVSRYLFRSKMQPFEF